MKRWILVTSGKGGVGKSLVARLLAETKRESEPTTWLIDGDGEVGQLVQYLGTRDRSGKLVPEQSGDVGVGTFALHGWRDDTGMRDLLDGLIAPLRTARTDVLVDLPAASLAVLETLERDAGLATGAARLGFRPTLVVPISPLVASRHSIAEALDLGSGYDIVAVRSEFWGNDSDYRRWLGSKLRADFLERGGREVVIPACVAGSSSIWMSGICPSPPPPSRGCSIIPTTRCSPAGSPKHASRSTPRPTSWGSPSARSHDRT